MSLREQFDIPFDVHNAIEKSLHESKLYLEKKYPLDTVKYIAAEKAYTAIPGRVDMELGTSTRYAVYVGMLVERVFQPVFYLN